MAKYLEDWIATDVAQAQELSVGELSSQFFFRDPTRANYIDHEHFYSPADGTILYQKVIDDPTAPIVEIKGVNYTLQDAMGDADYTQPSLVIGIFMSFYDIHINRIPYGGYLSYKYIDAIESTNKPMLATEKDIFNGAINPNNLSYLKFNERARNKIYAPALDYTYYMIQIADEDVKVISHFAKYQNSFFDQNKRFSFIRWGSQVDLILPLDARYDFALLLENTMHVEAGLDKLVKINRK